MLSTPDVGDVLKSMDEIDDPSDDDAFAKMTLDDVVLDMPVGNFMQKLLKINQFFKSNWMELAGRCADVLGSFSSVVAVWKYEEAMKVPLEKRTRATKLERRSQSSTGVCEIGASSFQR